MRSTRRPANRKGFTLIELLIVVVIIGILAAVAIPRFSNTKEKAFVASMKSDLKNLVSAQESFYADSNRYAGSTSIQAAPYSYKVSNGTTITDITGTATGWKATISNAAVAAAQRNCYIFGGTETNPPATQDGVPVCGT